MDQSSPIRSPDHPPSLATGSPPPALVPLQPQGPRTATLDSDGVITATTPSWDAYALAHWGDLARCAAGDPFLSWCDKRDDHESLELAGAIRTILRAEGAMSTRSMVALASSVPLRVELWVTSTRSGHGPGAAISFLDSHAHVAGPGSDAGHPPHGGAAPTARDALLAAWIYRVASDRLFAATLAIASLAEELGVDGRQRAASLVADIDLAIRELTLVAGALTSDDDGP